MIVAVVVLKEVGDLGEGAEQHQGVSEGEGAISKQRTSILYVTIILSCVCCHHDVL